jgi:hypothetical protein
MFSSDDEDIHSNQMVASESEDEGIYPFRRNRNCDYYKVSFEKRDLNFLFKTHFF